MQEDLFQAYSFESNLLFTCTHTPTSLCPQTDMYTLPIMNGTDGDAWDAAVNAETPEYVTLEAEDIIEPTKPGKDFLKGLMLGLSPEDPQVAQISRVGTAPKKARSPETANVNVPPAKKAKTDTKV